MPALTVTAVVFHSHLPFTEQVSQRWNPVCLAIPLRRDKSYLFRLYGSVACSYLRFMQSVAADALQSERSTGDKLIAHALMKLRADKLQMIMAEREIDVTGDILATRPRRWTRSSTR